MRVSIETRNIIPSYEGKEPKSRVECDDTKTNVLVAHYSCLPLRVMIILRVHLVHWVWLLACVVNIAYQVWGGLLAVKEKQSHFIMNLGPITEALFEKIGLVDIGGTFWSDGCTLKRCSVVLSQKPAKMDLLPYAQPACVDGSRPVC